MPFCPECRSEYRAGFTDCASCGGVPLVGELGAEAAPVGTIEAVEAALEAGTAVVVARGPLGNANEMRDALARDRVPAIVWGDPAACASGTCTSWDVLIAPGTEDAARDSLARGFQAALVNEGVSLESATAVVDLSAGADGAETETTCPACGTTFTAVVSEDLECPDCGLFLGVPPA